MSRPHPLSNSILPSTPSSSSGTFSAADRPSLGLPAAKRSRLNPASTSTSLSTSSVQGSTTAAAAAVADEAPDAAAPRKAQVEFSAVHASGALQRIIAAALREAGFDAAEADVLWAVEDQLINWMNVLLSSSKDRAEQLGRRTRPSPRDLLAAALDDGGLELAELAAPAQENMLLREPLEDSTSFFSILPPPAPPPAFLPHGPAPLPAPTTSLSCKPAKHAAPPLPYAPAHLPPLPPPHSYLSTPAPTSPPKPDPTTRAADIGELEARYGQTRTVERALVRLIDRTTHAGKEGSLEEGLRDLGLGVVGWRVRERAQSKRKAQGG